MSWIALSLALSQAPATATPATSWRRVYTSPALHVGVGVSALLSSEEIAAGITVQISTRAL